MTLLTIDPDWVTLRAVTEDGLPIVVLVDRAVVASAPHEQFPCQVAVAVPFQPDADGLPVDSESPGLREREQHLVDAAAGEGRLVAVMTLEGVREWIFYSRSAQWAQPFADAGISVVVADDPDYQGLRELAGATG